MAAKATRRYGQHFLQSEAISARILELAEVRSGDRILEIGPGLGALTAPLLERGARVLAIEIDRSLIAPLHARFGSQPGFRLECSDALTLDLAGLLESMPGEGLWKLVSNLPYNEATAILQRLIETRSRFESLTVMVQREVSDRLLAQPGTREIGYVTHLLGYYFEIQRGFQVRPGSFKPPPKVMSAVIRLVPRTGPLPLADNGFYLQLLQHGFTHRRKTLRRALREIHIPDGALEAALMARGLPTDARAEALSLEDFIWLARRLENPPRRPSRLSFPAN